jgi:hypothetical protein
MNKRIVVIGILGFIATILVLWEAHKNNENAREIQNFNNSIASENKFEDEALKIKQQIQNEREAKKSHDDFGAWLKKMADESGTPESMAAYSNWLTGNTNSN